MVSLLGCNYWAVMIVGLATTNPSALVPASDCNASRCLYNYCGLGKEGESEV